MFENMAPRSAVLDQILGSGKSVIVLRFPSREIARTKSATALLDAWFSPVERGIGALPRDLLKIVEQANAERTRGLVGPWRWKRESVEADLRVEVSPLPEWVGVGCWMLMLREVPHSPPLPDIWKLRLTEAERAVVSGILLGRDNKDIAEERGSKVTTVKAQVRKIFDKLGVNDRKKLFNLYRMLMDD